MYCVYIDKLSRKIVECATTKEAIADEIGIARSTFYRRLKNDKLLIGDILKICDVLQLSSSEAIDIFLSQKFNIRGLVLETKANRPQRIRCGKVRI